MTSNPLEPGPGPGRADELLELHDRLDRMDEQVRIRNTLLRMTALVSLLLAVPLLGVLFVNEVPAFSAYVVTFVLVLGAILHAVRHERRRLEGEAEELRARIRSLMRVPPGLPPEGD
jgi:hypothetical protein